MQKTILVLLCGLCLCWLPLFLSGCTADTTDAAITQAQGNLPPLATARVGGMTGSTGEKYLLETYPDARYDSFDAIPDAIAALQGNKLDYVITARTTAQNFVQKNSDLQIAYVNVLDEGISIALKKDNPQLLEKIDEIITRYKEDGTMDEIIGHWIKPSGEPYELVEIPQSNSGQVLRVAIAANREPVNFVYNNQYAGLDIELIQRIAYELDMQVEFFDMQFSALLAHLQSDKSDVIISNMTATEERKQAVNFSQIYFENPQVILSRKPVSDAAQAPVGEFTELSQFANRKVGIPTGSIFDKTLQEYAPPTAETVYFNNLSDELTALKAHKIDGFLTDEPVARMLSRQDSVTYFQDNMPDDHYGYALSLENTALRDEIDSVLTELFADGTIDRLKAKWMDGEEKDKVLEEVTLTGEKGVLQFITDPTQQPFIYVKDGEVVGYDLDILRLVCEKLGYDLEITLIDLGGIISGISSGKYDIAACCISITEERMKSVSFTQPNYDGGTVMVVRQVAPQSDVGFWQGIKNSFEKTFITEARWKMVVSGIGVTLLLSLGALVLGTLLGVVVCMGRRSRHTLLSGLARVYIRLVQGIPTVVFLMILYYIVFASSRMDGVYVAIVGFALNFAAYVSEMMRTGVEAVDRGQLEAATAVGLNKLLIFRKIVFPQAARYVIPIFKGEFIAMVKMTSVVGYIAVQDLTKVTDIIRGRTYEAFFPLIATAVIYFLLSFGLASLLDLIQVKIDPKQRQRRVKGVTDK